MSISKERREEIEDKWIETVKFDQNGCLCRFTELFPNEIGKAFERIWENRPFVGWYSANYKPAYMYSYLGKGYSHEEAYLLRALTLNMLLDDN